MKANGMGFKAYPKDKKVELYLHTRKGTHLSWNICSREQAEEYIAEIRKECDIAFGEE